MAGAVLLSKGAGLSMSTPTFDYIAESTRNEIPIDSWAVVAEVYRAYDHEGMMFLDLMDATPQCFAIFYAATVRALKAAESRNPNFPKTIWEELCEKMEEDPRHVA